ncbi:MAG: bifunctional DNA-formamidopyrimidine glycosylase/DNA-(apurinic or apyrimidinic site) lyase [Chromatiales bacterium]|jgi:formamidopyrimidine-DNA glycosylase
MPELPEVETSCRGIRPHIEKHKVTDVIVREKRLRWPIPNELPQLLRGRKLLSVQRRAKYLLLGFTHGTLILHLGMSGSLRIVPTKQPALAHDHFDLVFGKTCLRLRDPRKFGAVLWTDEPVEQYKLIQHLGPEPLSDAFNTDYLFKSSRKRNVAIKNFIMNAQVVVGVGNIYANESLFMAGIHPNAKAGKVSRARYDKLVDAIKQVLAKAIEQGGTTLRDFTSGDGKPGYFAQELQVYGRTGEACLHCSAPIQQVRIGQRSSFFCPVCQKR